MTETEQAWPDPPAGRRPDAPLPRHDAVG
jgi:hypothetical protein